MSPCCGWRFRLLLILFLITLAGSAWVQIRDGRKDTLFDAINDIDIIASLSAAKLGPRRAPADRAAAVSLLDAVWRRTCLPAR